MRSLKIAALDVSIVLGVSAMYVALELAGLGKRWSFLGVGLVLIAYFTYLAVRRPYSSRELGFRVDNLRSGLLPIGAFTAIAGVGLVVYGLGRGLSPWHRQVLVLLALYPAWAVIQQLAFQGLLHRSLMRLTRSRALQVAVAAAAFAAVHIGNAKLVALTFIAGLFWSAFYRRWPNLWLLAGSHSILAALAYPLVLGDAPLSRL